MIFAASLLPLLGCGLVACNDELTTIGSSLSKGEVVITMDSIETVLSTSTRLQENIDSRSYTKLLGRISVPEYGSLGCSFVTQMVCSNKMNIPDSIGWDDIDSVRLVLSVPRGSLTGDSLAPQQLKVYPLNRMLPDNFGSNFSPEGYYDPAESWGTESYTLSVISRGDSVVKKENYIRIPLHVPEAWARKVFEMYRANDPVFQWPSTFNEFFPGLYVEPSFGNGCIGNVTKAEINTYWHHTASETQLVDSVYKPVSVIKRDSLCLMSSQPIVNCTNLISYNISDRIKQLVAEGHPVLTTPGGYVVDFSFPVDQLLKRYEESGQGMAVVSALEFSIPATTIRNEHGLDVAPYLLMVKTKDCESFFSENRVPDNVTSFYAPYNATSGAYRFASMRQYFLNLYDRYRAGEEITSDDTDFTLIPVEVKTEVVEGYSSSTTYVTRCSQYILKPTMTQLAMDRALICFTFSNQALD